MTTLLGIGLLALVVATLVVFVAAWRWLTRPTLSDEVIEALWNAIAELHEAVYRLETSVSQLERMHAFNSSKHSRVHGGEN